MNKISKILHHHITTNLPLMESELRVGSEKWLALLREYRELCKIKPEYITKSNKFLLDENVAKSVIVEGKEVLLNIPYPIYDSPTNDRLYEVVTERKGKPMKIQFTEDLNKLVDLQLEYEFYQKKGINESVKLQDWIGENYIQCDKINEAEYIPNLTGKYALKAKYPFIAPNDFKIQENLREDLVGRGYDCIKINESYFIFSPLQVCELQKNINESVDKDCVLKLCFEQYTVTKK